MHRFLSAIIFSLVAFTSFSQTTLSRPKLVVGIVVDQMRWDYLYRYYDRFGSGGFKRMVTKGFSCENTYIPYTPTYTAAGHASVYTGSTPAVNGILGNYWYNRDLKRNYYCSEDSTVTSVGSTSNAGKMSPRNLLSSTITDELRLATNFQGKSIGIAIKDRGAILPAGHSANAAYWFDNSTGGWITSTFYMNELPDWVKKFNDKKLPEKYMSKVWNPLYGFETYKQSTADDMPFESGVLGEDNTFPHRLDTISNRRMEAFKYTPFGNTYTYEMAKAAIEGEKLGQRGVTDFLAVSFSSTDYIGHAFGPNSIEVEDTYLRLDKEMEALLKYLDQKIGVGQYLVFLTSDHGIPHVPTFLKDNKFPAGAKTAGDIKKWLNDNAEKKYGVANLIEQIIIYQVYINHKLVKENKIDEKEFKSWIISELLSDTAVMAAYDLPNLSNQTIPAKIKDMITLGYNQKLSGDIQFVFYPHWFDGWNKGTTHGAWYPYDKHIPLLWFGWKIKPGKTNRETYMTDIAPTLAALLRIQMPSGTVGEVITEITH